MLNFRQVKISILFIALIFLAGCANKIPRPSETKLVPLHVVISQLKCELAHSILESDSSVILLEKATMTGTLESKIITGYSGSASVGIPKLVPIGSGASGSFGIDASAAVGSTSTATTNFKIVPRVGNSDICDNGSIEEASSLGIRDWLKSLELIEEGEPRIGVTSLKYKLEFGVKYTADAKATVLFVPISISASAKALRDDVQTLTFNVTASKDAIVLKSITGNVQ
ncbi:MAG: hypothetical protein NXI17_23670 [Alphaproteobacteria bacterium]|nr:hypothetical protein [Alphaproteobacteria bacterium]